MRLFGDSGIADNIQLLMKIYLLMSRRIAFINMQFIILVIVFYTQLLNGFQIDFNLLILLTSVSEFENSLPGSERMAYVVFYFGDLLLFFLFHRNFIYFLGRR